MERKLYFFFFSKSAIKVMNRNGKVFFFIKDRIGMLHIFLKNIDAQPN